MKGPGRGGKTGMSQTSTRVQGGSRESALEGHLLALGALFFGDMASGRMSLL